MGRNALGARLPPSLEQAAPHILPDGSKSQHHGGSFGAYMAHKNRKLQEQFQDQAKMLPGQRRTRLFEGVSIHVNGFTNPSHLELKQLMALHGGRFVVYPSRSTPITHVVCSNLPDAKVKQLQRERSPTPVVRPEWIVHSIKAGHLLPIKDYALWQLRDAPGQRKLKGFVQVHPADLPPSAIFGDHAGAVGNTVEQQSAEVGTSNSDEHPSAQPVAAAAAGTEGRQVESSFNCDAPPPELEAQLAADSQQGLFPQAPQQFSFGPPCDPGQMPFLANQVCSPLPPGEPGPGSAVPSQPSHESAPRVAVFDPGTSEAQAAAAAGVTLAAGAASAGAVPAGMAGEEEDVKHAQGTYDAAEMQRAQQIAARMRTECDILKGPPRSSNDDPEFVDSFFKASRLHYIGTYKSRIKALMASAAGSQGPSPLPPGPGRPPTIVHLDMDCFFAAVAEADHPIFKGKPLAVCHSASTTGTGEVSTCNYEARKFSVHSGMMIREAMELCPQLIVVPYLFEKYAAVSEKVYRILLRRTSCVQPLSCDEALLDITGLGDPLAMVADIRAEIEAATGCTASAGIGPNPLVARITTENAKPNGQIMVVQQQAPEFLRALPVGKLPGIGYANEARLVELGIHTVAGVQASSKQFLQVKLGDKLGAMLWDHAHGIDKRQVEPMKAHKSVGAECNYGVRFQSLEESRAFMNDLAAQVQGRLRGAGAKGRTVTLKIMRRKQGAGEPCKYMGHGVCNNLSRSATLASSTNSSKDIASRCWELLCNLKVPFADIRGMGIAVSRLSKDSAPPTVHLGATALAGMKQDGIAAFFQKTEQRQGQQQQQQQPHQDALRQRQRQQQHFLRSPDGTKKSPGSTRQAHLDLVPQFQAAAAAVGAYVEEESRQGVQGRQQLLQQWQGVSLSQMDATVLAALPWSVQKQLIEGAPRRELECQHEGQQVAGSFGAGADPAAVDSLEAAGMGEQAAAARPAAQQQAQYPLQQLCEQPEQQPHSSNEEDGWETDSQPDADEVPAERPAMPQRMPQQQHASGAAVAGSGTHAAGSGRCGGGSPVVALPALSQIDPLVMEALPLQMRRELELAYGIGRHAKRPVPGRRGCRGGGGPAAGAAGAGSLLRYVGKHRRIDSFVTNPPLPGVTGSGRALVATPGSTRQEQEQVALSLSQVDPSVLEELPAEVRREVMQQLKQGAGAGRPCVRRQHRSRLGLQHNEQRVWQQRWEEEQRQQQVEGMAAACAARTIASQHEQEEWQQQEERHGCKGGQLSAPVQLFLRVVDAAAGAGGPTPASSLAGALAACLEQLQAQQAGNRGISPAPLLHSPSLEPSRGRTGPAASSGCDSDGGIRSNDGNGSMDLDLPPTQLVAVEEPPSAAATREPGGAAASAGNDGMQASPHATFPQQGSSHRPQQQVEELADGCAGGATSGPTCSQHMHEEQRAALSSSIQRAATALLAARDLEQLHLLLLAVQRLGRRHPWFAAYAGDAAVEAAQQQVQAAYGWRLRLPGMELPQRADSSSEALDLV